MYRILLAMLLSLFLSAAYAGATDEDLVVEGDGGSAGDAASAASAYEEGLNAMLHEMRDVWGESLMAAGGATYENIKDYLQPLLYSTGMVNTAHGMHNVLFAEEGGKPPYIVALADGSRLAANVYQSGNDLRLGVGREGMEAYGSVFNRVDGPYLEEGYYPILQTGYTDAEGVSYEQESFASRVEGVNHLVAFIRIASKASDSAAVRCTLGGNGASLRASKPAEPGADAQSLSFALDSALYLIWSPQDVLPENVAPDAMLHEAARIQWKTYWDASLARGTQFRVPEPLVMNCQRNLLIQNLILRWRYSLGSVVYHDSFFQPESSDAMSLLAMYGYAAESRAGLSELIDKTKGAGYYVNWERGEKLSHGAEYYFLSGDSGFIAEHTPAYVALCNELKRQIENDPHGLLEKQRHCGDIPQVDYCTFHQAVCWQGIRNMSVAWRLSGFMDLAEEYGALAARFKKNLLRAVATSEHRLSDGSVFVPSILLNSDEPVYTPITSTRMGSYWNLCMPYAFASGLWDFNGSAMRGILNFLHQHGATLLGLLRFNYYPIEIGSYHPQGLPGYWTTGYDNVYLPSYLRVLAQCDEAERLVLSFYGKLAHGQTRNTFVSGEGDTVGVFPGLEHRSCYGAVCSANNMAFLLPLRLMLIRESYDPETGLPAGLYLAHATPRQWLEPGKMMEASNAPTAFGPVSYTIAAAADNRIDITLAIPDRNPIQTLRLKVRLPGQPSLRKVILSDGSSTCDGTHRLTCSASFSSLGTAGNLLQQDAIAGCAPGCRKQIVNSMKSDCINSPKDVIILDGYTGQIQITAWY